MQSTMTVHEYKMSLNIIVKFDGVICKRCGKPIEISEPTVAVSRRQKILCTVHYHKKCYEEMYYDTEKEAGHQANEAGCFT